MMVHKKLEFVLPIGSVLPIIGTHITGWRSSQGGEGYTSVVAAFVYPSPLGLDFW